MNHQIRIRPIRLMGYLVLFLLDLALYFFLHSYFLWLIAIMMIVWLVISVVGVRLLAERLTLDIGMGEKRICRGKSLLVDFRLKNPLWYVCLDCGIKLQLANSFYDITSELTLTMPVRCHGESDLELSVQLTDLGRFYVECKSLQVQDVLGIMVCQKKLELVRDFYVIPDSEGAKETDVTNFLQGASETEESNTKGSDFAEVSDIREYMPGDKIRDIHWKLSAKQDTLMVKERVSLAGSEIVICPDFTLEKEEMEGVLEQIFSVGREFIKQRMPVCILCWSQGDYQFQEYRVDSEEGLAAAMEQIFSVPLKNRICDRTESLLRNCYPFINSYLLVWSDKGQVQMKLCE